MLSCLAHCTLEIILNLYFRAAAHDQAAGFAGNGLAICGLHDHLCIYLTIFFGESFCLCCGFAYFRVVDLAGNAQGDGQVKLSCAETIDAVQADDVFHFCKALRVFDGGDDEEILVGLFVIVSGSAAAIVVCPGERAGAAAAQRRIEGCFYKGYGVFSAADVWYKLSLIHI